MMSPSEPSRFVLRPLALLCIAALVAVIACTLSLKTSTGKVHLQLDGVEAASCATVPWLQWMHGCQGMARLELADDPPAARALVSELYRAPATLQAAIRQTEGDYFFILSYAAFLCLVSINVAHWAGALGRRFARGVLLCVAVLQPIAGFLDGIENIGLFAMLTNGAVTPDVHAWTLGVSTVKWWLVTAGVLTPIGGSLYLLIARRKSGQGGAPVPAAGTAQVQVANR